MLIKDKTKLEEELLTQAGELFQKKDLNQAQTLLRQIIKHFPHSPEAFYNLGLVLGEKKLYPQAISAYKKAIKLLPTFELAHLNLGVSYVRNKQLDLGINTFQNSIKKNSENHDALFNLGLALVKKNQLFDAIDTFRQALLIKPQYMHTYFQLGSLFTNVGKLETASNFFIRALELDPTFAPAQAALGSVFAITIKTSEAIKALNKAIELGIDPDYVAETLYSLARKCCDWEKAKIYSERLDQISKRIPHDGQSAIEPLFTNIERVDNPQENLKMAKYVSETIENQIKKIKKNFPHQKRNSHTRLRIGYLSHEFHNHPVTSQIIDLLEYHDRKQFEIFAYSYGDSDHSDLRLKVETNAEHFIDLVNTDHQKIADRIHADKIDILVDLVGFTGFHRQDILAYRPASIQINYLGFPGTTGSKYVDYLIADRIVVPTAEQKFYTEKILYLPNCYQLCSPQKVSRQKFTKKDFGLPDGAFVFASFNRHSKIDQEMFDVWISILKQVPNSVLWLYVNQEEAKNNLRTYFENTGLSTKRLIFAGKMPLDKHLARLKLVDLALDTHIYSGGATTANNLWAGIPVITVYGRHYLSRMSSSILTNIGLPELIAKNLNEYEKLAVKLALHLKKLTYLKLKLEKNKSTYSLFNSKLFTKNLEGLYLQIWKDNQTPRK